MERAPHTPSLENTEQSPTVLEGLRELLSYEQEQFFMDRGGVGEVYSLPQGFCIKIMDPRHNSKHKHLFNLGNSALQEYHFQEIMSRTNSKGTTRTPRVFGVLSGVFQNDKSALVMERLLAVNLEHALLRRQRLPEHFEIDSFFDSLETYIQHAHEEEEILHGDLFARNVMVDSASGQPRVIDWGRAQHLNFIKDERKKQKLISDEWDNINMMYESVRALQM